MKPQYFCDCFDNINVRYKSLKSVMLITLHLSATFHQWKGMIYFDQLIIEYTEISSYSIQSLMFSQVTLEKYSL